MILHRKNGTTLKYHFQRSSCDFVGEFLNDTVICLELHELKDETPCLLLMFAETQSIMTKIHRKDRFKLMHIVTITEDDNLMSNFGRAKWRRCIRGASDCVFFAGPCTGGSPWNRLNKKRQRCHRSQHSHESIVVLGALGRVCIVFTACT